MQELAVKEYLKAIEFELKIEPEKMNNMVMSSLYLELGSIYHDLRKISDARSSFDNAFSYGKTHLINLLTLSCLPLPPLDATPSTLLRPSALDSPSLSNLKTLLQEILERKAELDDDLNDLEEIYKQ